MAPSAPDPQPAFDFARLDLLPYGIIVLDPQGTVLYYNSREEVIAGRSRLDVLGKNFFTEVAPCTQLTVFSHQFAETIERAGVTAEFDFHFPFPQRSRDVHVAITSFRYADQLLCLVSVQDLSEVSDVRRQIDHAQRFSEVGELTAGVAHNFNNVLMAIRIWAQVLARQHSEGSPSGLAAANILKAVSDGVKIVERVREGVIDPPAPSLIVDLCEVASRSVEISRSRIRGGQKIHLSVLCSGKVPVRADQGPLQEILVNLITNAIDAIPEEGTVTVQISLAGGDAVVEVSDTGVGMDRQTAEKIFRPLFTTKKSGTGLGLSTAYALARRYGGEIRVESQLGAGSRFTLRLPAASG